MKNLNQEKYKNRNFLHMFTNDMTSLKCFIFYVLLQAKVNVTSIISYISWIDNLVAAMVLVAC